MGTDTDTDERTEAVYQFIFDYFREHHVPPSIRDLIEGEAGAGTALGPITSTAVARWHIEKLLNQGRLIWKRVPQQGQRAPRGMRLPNGRFLLLTDDEWTMLENVVQEARQKYPAWREQLDDIYEELFGERGGGDDHG